MKHRPGPHRRERKKRVAGSIDLKDCDRLSGHPTPVSNLLVESRGGRLLLSLFPKGLRGSLTIRFKSAAKVTELMEALRFHRDNLWPGAESNEDGAGAA